MPGNPYIQMAVGDLQAFRWRLNGPETGVLELQATIQPCPTDPQVTVDLLSDFVYRSGDGASYQFPNRLLLPNEGDCNADMDVTEGTADSAVARLFTPEATGDWWILLKDGTKITLPHVGDAPSAGVSRISDPNGNEITPHVDTLGRIQSDFSYRDSSGATRTFIPTYSSTTYTPDLSQLTASCTGYAYVWGGTKTVPALTRLDLPNGLAYRFQYDPQFGELRRIDLPSGGYIRWEYVTIPFFDEFPSEGRTQICKLDSRRVSKRAVSADGVNEDAWTYGYQFAGGHYVTTVIDPEGNRSVYEFEKDGIHQLSSDVYLGTTTFLRGEDQSWAFTETHVRALSSLEDGFRLDKRRWRVVQSDVRLPNGLVSRHATTYDSYTETAHGPFAETRLNPVEERFYDWGPGAPGALLRDVQYEWLHDISAAHRDRHIWNRMTARTVMGSEGVVARTEFEYDGGSLTSTNGTVVQHDYADYGPAMNVRGNQTKRRDWLDTENRCLETVSEYDDVGNLIRTVNPRGKQTLFSYVDSWTGANCAPGQTRAFLTAATNAYGHVSTRSNFSCSSLTASATDPNGRITSFGYDLMDRLKSVTAPDGGQHLRFYSDLDLGATHQGQPVFRDAGVLPLRSKSFTSIESGLWKGDLKVLDGLGRIRLTALRNGGTPGFQRWDFLETGYDANGRRAFVSNPLSLFSTSDYPAQFFPDKTQTFYDALGRVVSIVAQDGQASTISYDGNERTATDQAGASRRIREDGLGRIVRVREPDAPTGSLDSGDYSDTFYEYDRLDNLMLVEQGPGSDGDGAGGTVQTRGFVYDSLSRLIQESQPESGTTFYPTTIRAT